MVYLPLGVLYFLLCKPSSQQELLNFRTKTLTQFALRPINVHYIIDRPGTGRWFVDGWEARKDSLSEAVGTIDADIIGFQEMETFSGRNVSDTNLTLDWLLKTHPQYTAGAVGNPTVFPSTQPIFFRSDRFTLLDQGWFFFSKTPEKIYSRTFNGSYPAFASWVELKETKTNKIFKVVISTPISQATVIDVSH